MHVKVELKFAAEEIPTEESFEGRDKKAEKFNHRQRRNRWTVSGRANREGKEDETRAEEKGGIHA